MAPAIAIGNTVVVKPSRPTSQSTVLLGRLATDADLPDGSIYVVTGNGPDVGAALAERPDVRRIAYAGSVEAGRVLAGQAAGRLIPLTLELGAPRPGGRETTAYASALASAQDHRAVTRQRTADRVSETNVAIYL